MSIKVMSLVWEGFPASGSEMLAMLALADWCNDEGGSLHPSMKAVAEKIRVSEKQARRIIHGFEEEGYLKVVGHANGGAPGTTKQYQLNVAKLKGLADGAAARKTAPVGVTPPADVTPPPNVTPPVVVTPPTQGCGGLPPMGGEASHGCPETPPTHGSQTVSEPPMNHQLTVRGTAPCSEPERLPAVAKAPAPQQDPAGETRLQAACRTTWAAYRNAYAGRYGAAPVRNQKVSSQVKQFVQRIGYDESPLIAAWFVQHPGSYYVGRMHDFGCLLSDAEKLRTEWVTGRLMTAGKARQSDRAGTTMAALAEVLAERGESL